MQQFHLNPAGDIQVSPACRSEEIDGKHNKKKELYTKKLLRNEKEDFSSLAENTLMKLLQHKCFFIQNLY